MRINDIKLHTALAPASRATAATTYNGAAVASAVGIPVKDAGQAIVALHLGAISASTAGVAYGLYASGISTGPSGTGELVAIADATLAITDADANTDKLISVKTANIEGVEDSEMYLYLKRVQSDTEAEVAYADVILTEHQDLPVLPKAGTADFDVDV